MQESRIDLVELVVRIYEHHRRGESKLERAADRMAAELVLETEPLAVQLTEARQERLHLLITGEIGHSDIGDDEPLRLAFTKCRGFALEQLHERQAAKLGMKYFEPELWDVVVAQVTDHSTTTFIFDDPPGFEQTFDDRLRDYCALGSLRARLRTDRFSAEVARLNGEGFGEALASLIWDKFPKEARRLLLPWPADRGKPPLTDIEGRVLRLIQDSPKGISGSEVVTRLRAFNLEQSTLTRHIIPVLKAWHGVANRPGVGYYIAAS